MITDLQLANLLQQLKDALLDNNPVVAYIRLESLTEYLAHKYIKESQP